jgi:hypothetical protein
MRLCGETTMLGLRWSGRRIAWLVPKLTTTRKLSELLECRIYKKAFPSASLLSENLQLKVYARTGQIWP